MYCILLRVAQVHIQLHVQVTMYNSVCIITNNHIHLHTYTTIIHNIIHNEYTHLHVHVTLPLLVCTCIWPIHVHGVQYSSLLVCQLDFHSLTHVCCSSLCMYIIHNTCTSVKCIWLHVCASLHKYTCTCTSTYIQYRYKVDPIHAHCHGKLHVT